MVFDEDRPFHRAMEIVAHEEAAAQQEFAKLGNLRIGQSQWPTSTAYSHG